MKTIAGTLPLDAASATTWDAIAIGAGCAGSIAARELARIGVRVLLIDKANFPRYKVCGCCINRPAQQALESIGLGALLTHENAVYADAFDVRAGKLRANFALPNYAILSRERLDAALVQAAIDAGAAFLPGTQATLHAVRADRRTVSLRNSEKSNLVNARIVILADGLGSRLLRATDEFESPAAPASRLGMGAVSREAPPDYRPGTVYMACSAHGYVGACRREDGCLTIAAACDAAFVRDSGGMAQAVESILCEAGFPSVPDLKTSPWKGTPALTRNASTVAAHRAFVLGDAAGYVEPFTGEGMKWAIESAIALAPIAREAADRYDSRHEQNWIAARQRIVTHRTAVCRLLAASLRYPALVKTALRVLAVAPVAAAPFVRSLNAPLPAQKEVAL